VLEQKGHHVSILAPRPDGEIKECPNVFYCPTFSIKDKSTLKRFMNNIGVAVSSFFVSFKAGKADTVITTSPPALISMAGWLIAKFKKAKLVYDVRDIWPDVAWEMGSFEKDSFFSKVFQFIRNFMLKHSDLVTTVSPGKVKKLQNYMMSAHVMHITNGLDENFLKNKDYPELADKYAMDKKFTCVYVGNLGLAQGLMQLLNIAKRAKENGMDVQFLLFGGGMEENILKQHACDMNLDNVVFAGRLPNVYMYTVLKHAQLSFVSLKSDKMLDSVPTKMFEALGVGCPVLLSAVGDAADILNESKLGIAVTPNDEEALWTAFLEIYEHLEQILKHREDAKKLMLTKYSRQSSAALLEKELMDIQQ
ncbi:MAG: glycosyltransferase family 4 protein, partial [Clostridia bacterium]|nr:glycosyltransferase family 4 protein [Clostridia bacterium]